MSASPGAATVGTESNDQLLKEVLRLQRDMAAKLIEMRGHVVGVELAVLAVTEQLVACGTIDAQRAAATLQELAGQIEPEQLRAVVQPQIDDVAERLRDLAPQAVAEPIAKLRLVDSGGNRNGTASDALEAR